MYKKLAIFGLTVFSFSVGLALATFILKPTLADQTIPVLLAGVLGTVVSALELNDSRKED